MSSSLVFLLALIQGVPSDSIDAEEAFEAHRELRVLYAGFPGGSREFAFEDFLADWFDEVEFISLEDLNMEAAEPFDVVIADWTSHYGNDGYDEKVPPINTMLGPDFTRPVVAINYTASSLRSGYKLNWL